jgi:hypothetical protein
MRHIHRFALASVVASVALAAGCTGGVGPVGIDIIAQREDPTGGKTAGGGSRAATSSLDCAGTYECTAGANGSDTAKLTEENGVCKADYGGAKIELSADGTVLINGQRGGTWTAKGSTINVCTLQGDCASCTKKASSSSADGGGSSGGTSSLKALGEACAVDGDCAAGGCAPAGYCSLRCLPGDAGVTASVCAVTPFNGVCSSQGFCNKS